MMTWSPGAWGKGVTGVSSWVPQMAALRELMIKKTPRVTITTPSALRRSIGRTSVRSMPAPRAIDKNTAITMAIG